MFSIIALEAGVRDPWGLARLAQRGWEVISLGQSDGVHTKEEWPAEEPWEGRNRADLHPRGC